MANLIKNAGRPINVLNLFAYTGGATVACLKAGASVCHVDAAKGMVERAGENCRLSNVGEGKVRFIIDDCLKFVQREIRRGRKYDAIIMDPPSFGRGPNGETWKIENELYNLVKTCTEVLSDNPLFFLINSYTTGLQPQVLKNILTLLMPKGDFKVEAYEVGIPTKEGIVLPCGCSGLWQVNN
jgi:23S rRNA (cytosine1962-C5)-methyltransferase